VLLFFSLAVLVGFGAHWLYEQIVPRSKPLGYFILALLAGLLLFEYLVFPFPTMEPLCSRFYHQLAQEEGEFAVADFPMGRRWAKYYLFCQTIHGKKIVDGVVSRTPYDAYTFVDADPLLGPLRAGAIPDPETDVAGQFAALADQGIRYIIVHKHLLQPNEIENWKRWLDHFPDPFYEDDLLIVYATLVQAHRDLELAYEIGAEAGMLHVSVAPIEVTQGGSIFVNFHRGNEGTLSLSLTDVPTGTSLLAVGVYDPDTSNRLLAMNASDERVPDDRILLPGKITR
jgi:hypothetical protein